MNTPPKMQHPEWMSDDDIAIYDQMIAIGRLQIGKEIPANEEYLLHLASMITLRQMKGMVLEIDDPTIVELKRIHKEFQEKGLIHETPPNEFYASVVALKEKYISDDVQAQIDEINGSTSNLVIDEVVKKTSNIEDEPADADIKENWVKLVEPNERPEPELVEATPEP